MCRPKFSWNDYFIGNLSPTLGSGNYTSTRTLSGTNVYVLNCLFTGCISSSGGGAIYCTSTFLLVESSSFFSCRTSSGNGGAVYFINIGSGQCAIHEVCCYDCYAGDLHGQFARVDVKNSASSKNYVNYSSITRCVNEKLYAYDTLCLCYGMIYCQSINISMNECHYTSGINCFSGSNYVTCSLSYSLFVNNSATNDICILFDSTGLNREMKCCNILRNTQVTSTHELIHANQNLVIADSCILENNATCIFYSSSSYTVDHSLELHCRQNFKIWKLNNTKHSYKKFHSRIEPHVHSKLPHGI
jgi:predicted outer membrane repeat protein